ncbi:FKBP-type peptidyl-prolyl cis-trans isomerase [Dactylosporangium sp. AC04546]|uniref:FKBP-type peptidyl-prolyl cis-trans isomerase n=1 Tax=Dactylosporangium sp. AC04546 TaxID=2862460 RepID=UPI001EDF6DE6|nr:FKBP-type peptidyl-prolyl cis-trans isomerase [Dactylosporangium sp. AC04546]WVK85908.1 FKBP-type peptidyl-prolyl cis-trans isomerase [Dactylosporangium sp. AC04546]
MSDRGRSRRTARSTKATPPKAVAPEQETPEETPVEASVEAPDTADLVGTTEEVSSTEPDGSAEDASGDPDEGDKADEADKADEPDASDASDASDDAAPKDQDKKAKADVKKGKGAPPPLTKADKRAAARKAAQKAANRRRIFQGIAGTVIVLLAVGGAFAGVWYFGDRAEERKTKCKPAAEAAYPPLLGGFDKRLATEPTVEKGTDEVKNTQKTVLIEGPCKAVKPGQTVTVNYIGVTYADGKMFDSSWTKKQTVDFGVGMKQSGKQQQVITGWDEALVGVKVGSRVQLDIPAKDAYGETPPQGAPAGTLRFVVDVLDAKDADDTGLGGLGG